MQVKSLLNQGSMPSAITIEVSSAFQIPSLNIIGLPTPEVSESKDRLQMALLNSGLPLPKRRFILNLSPAFLRKRGTGLDLAMAIALLDHAKPSHRRPKSVLAWGELGLNGVIKKVGQSLRALFVAWNLEAQWLILNKEDAHEAAQKRALLKRSPLLTGSGPQIIACSDLKTAWSLINHPKPLPSTIFPLKQNRTPIQSKRDSPSPLLPLSPAQARILGIAASGAHHLLLAGSHGSGKSHALDWLTRLLPPSSLDHRLEWELMYEMLQEPGVGPTSQGNQIFTRFPIRRVSPHTRVQSLLSREEKPGEFSLAHGGVLVADELLQWHRDSLESLREPLETRMVCVTKKGGGFRFPANFQLLATCNLCPCGAESQSPQSRCHCSFRAKRTYFNRLSKALMDRIDLCVIWDSRKNAAEKTPSVQLESLVEKVAENRRRAMKSFGAPAGQLSGPTIERLLQDLQDPGSFSETSLRARHKIARVALSIAVWEGRHFPKPADFLEARSYAEIHYV